MRVQSFCSVIIQSAPETIFRGCFLELEDYRRGHVINPFMLHEFALLHITIPPTSTEPPYTTVQ
jgi:hypothetical protein